MSVASQGQAARTRERKRRIAAARQRRLEIDSDQVERASRIDEAVADVDEAVDARRRAQQAIAQSDQDAGLAVGRLIAEKLTHAEIARLCGVDKQTVSRWRRNSIAAAGTSDQHDPSP